MKQLPEYSVAIRTLGTAGDKFVREIKSLHKQTHPPRKIVVYIAHGYKCPDTIGNETYVYVKKGMVAQRVLPYTEIDTPLILMLDDDVELAPDSAERMVKAMVEHDADCVAADTFRNHLMSPASKCYAVVTNLVFPHRSDKWATIIHANGSFSYNNHPRKPFYLAQSAAGPASLWKKEVFLALHYQDEMWLDDMGFPYGEDAVIFNKVYKNGYKLGMLYDSGVANLDGKSSSGSFQRDLAKFHTRSMATFLIWWRTCYAINTNTAARRAVALAGFVFKALWLLPIHLVAAAKFRSIRIVANYIKGYRDGWRVIRSPKFQALPNYILP